MRIQNLSRFVEKVTSWLPAIEESLSNVGWDGKIEMIPFYGGRMVEIYTNRKICSLRLLGNYHVVCYVPYPGHFYTERRLELYRNSSKVGGHRLLFNHLPILCSQVHLLHSFFDENPEVGRNIFSYDISYWAKRDRILHSIKFFRYPPMRIVFSGYKGILAVKDIRIPFSSPSSLKGAILAVVNGSVWLKD